MGLQLEERPQFVQGSQSPFPALLDAENFNESHGLGRVMCTKRPCIYQSGYLLQIWIKKAYQQHSRTHPAKASEGAHLRMTHFGPSADLRMSSLRAHLMQTCRDTL